LLRRRQEFAKGGPRLGLDPDEVQAAVGLPLQLEVEPVAAGSKHAFEVVLIRPLQLKLPAGQREGSFELTGLAVFGRRPDERSAGAKIQLNPRSVAEGGRKVPLRNLRSSLGRHGRCRLRGGRFAGPDTQQGIESLLLGRLSGGRRRLRSSRLRGSSLRG
jgi:hypothetical protein